MKKRSIFILLQIAFVAVGIISLISCDTDWLELDQHYVVVDYKAQDIRIGADNDITDVGFILCESDYGDGSRYLSGDTLFHTGGWFKLILDRKDPMHIVVSVDENVTGKDRRILVGAHRCVAGDTVRIIQKAKPELLIE